jgi:hypothetical protein
MTGLMVRALKLLIGLAVALAAGWVSHGPLGRGALYLDVIEARAGGMVRYAHLAGVQIHMQRDPMARTAILSGPANDFQREGIGDLEGINGRIESIPGVAGVRWTDEPPRFVMPLLAETLLLVAFFYLIGIGLGWVFFRPARESFL